VAGRKSEVKVPAGLVSGEASLLCLLMAAFSLCPYMAFSSLCLVGDGGDRES